MISDHLTLAEVRDLFRPVVENGGDYCPLCTQFAKVYKRSINSSMARDLIMMYRDSGKDWCHLPTVRAKQKSRGNREESKLRYWGLVREDPEAIREDGGRAGWWQVTDKGELWVQGKIRVPKYALVYDSRCLGLKGEPVDIQTALGRRFNLEELMSI